ncbi:MAG: hypothetical protein ABSD75_31930 [Terriglobales bacterium]|jgi:hypothetical protein
MQANEEQTAAAKSPDDTLTLVSLGIVAFVIAIVAHEGLGHGLATLAVGGKAVMLTTCYFSSSGSLSRWIPAAGGIANAVVGLLSILALRLLRTAGPHIRYFFTLVLAFNLFFAAGYPAYSGLAAFGDWAAVISGLSPAWLWQVLLVVFSVISYYLSLRLLAVEMRPFCGPEAREAQARLRRITLIPFVAALCAASFAGALNPSGWTIIFTAALPGAAAAFGLTQLDHFSGANASDSSVPAGPITLSARWIIAAVIILALFVGVLGPGIKFGQNS